MKPFAYQRPTDPAAAVTTVTGDADARYLGGGTNLVDLMKLGVEQPRTLVDVTGLPLDEIVYGDTGLRLGALSRNSDVAAHPYVRTHYPLVSQAILAGASGQLRNVATTGGNLLQRTRCTYFMDTGKPCNKREPGSGCAAREGEHFNHAILGATAHCIATHPSDLVVALAALDARVDVLGTDGSREVALADFYLPVGDTPDHETALGHGELITAVLLPRPPVGARSTYRKVRERASYAFAIGSIAALVRVDDGVLVDVRLALGAVASHPWRARQAEAALNGSEPGLEAFEAAAEAELAAAEPLVDNAYKVPLMRELIVSTLAELTEVSR